MALEVGRLVAALAVERVLDLHRDVRALGDRVRVVRIDVVHVHHHLHGRVADVRGLWIRWISALACPIITTPSPTRSQASIDSSVSVRASRISASWNTRTR